MRRGRDVVYFGAGQGARVMTALDGPSSPSNAGMRQKTHVPSGCDENERLRRHNSSTYHRGMSSSLFLVSISFSSQRGSRLILLGALSSTGPVRWAMGAVGAFHIFPARLVGELRSIHLPEEPAEGFSIFGGLAPVAVPVEGETPLYRLESPHVMDEHPARFRTRRVEWSDPVGKGVAAGANDISCAVRHDGNDSRLGAARLNRRRGSSCKCPSRCACE